MRIRLAVWVGTASTSARHVTLTAPNRCGLEDAGAERVAAMLAATLGVPGDAIAVRNRLVPDDVRLGYPPLVDGASVHLVEREHWNPARRHAPAAAMEIAVIGGPDAGRSRPLTPGRHTIGRAGADLTVADPALSRLHACVDVTATGITVTDLGSENGTLLDGEPLPGARREIATGQSLRLGHTTLTVRTTRLLPAATVPRGDGTLTVSRASAPLADAPQARIALPTPPEPPTRRRVPWVAALLPVPVALLLAWFFGPHLLLFALMSPLMVLGTVVSDRLGARRTYAEETRAHHAAARDCAARKHSALAAERVWREATFPDAVGIARIAMAPGRSLWSRPAERGHRMVVRLGRGTVLSGVTWQEGGTVRQVELPDAPVLLDLTQQGSVSITGPLAGRVVDGILGQLVCLHSPVDLTVLTDRSGWAHVPHVRTGTAPELVHEAWTKVRERDATTRVLVLAVSGSGLSGADLDTLSLICRQGRASGVIALVCGGHVTATRAHLQTAETALAVLTSSSTPPPQQTRQTQQPEQSEQPQHPGPDHGATDTGLVVDGVGAAWVGRIATALTALRDGTGPGGELPQTVRLADVLQHEGEPVTAERVRRRWAASDDGAWVTLGTGPTGPVRLDLAAAGPHALVGGTTGSGKSELLRTLVTSLAVEHPPEDVGVVLVDYKGGSAFAGLEELPHIVGVVTDLDHALTRRALASLRAEITRRERLLAQAGAADILAYRQRRRTPDSGLPHLPRLVIIIDEFRALADELPDFVAGLVRLAAVGRSLGLHLVLATQRPGGVVTGDMRANLNLRIALRVRDRTDSQDVIESDAAALLPRSLPGRALLRAGGERLESVQIATVTGGADHDDLTVEVAWSDGSATSRAFPTCGVDAPVDLVRVVATAARSGGHIAPPSPWLSPLTTSLAWTRSQPPAAWALLDDPSRQSQEPATLDLSEMRHTAIAGSLRSGRTTTALTMTLAAVADHHDAHLYALADPTGPLGSLLGLPHTGAVVDRADPSALGTLVDHLAAEIRRRQEKASEAYLLVVIDGWDILADACDRLDHGALTDRLLATLREGYALGVRAVVTGDRSVLTGRVGRTFPERLVHRPSDDTDLALAGLRPGEVPRLWPPGRLVRSADGIELQVLTRGVADLPVPPPGRSPWRLRTLPVRLMVTELPADPPGELGVGIGAQGRPVTVGQPGRRRLLVLGSAGSGRTTTLAALANRAATAGRVVCVVADPHAPPLLGGVTVIDWRDPDDLVELRRAHPGLVVVADDIDRHLDSPTVPVLEQISDLAERDGGLVAVAGDSSTIGLRPRGLGAAMARGRTAVVLGSPTVLDCDLVGARLPKVAEVIPGRGWVVLDRCSTQLQVALPDDARRRRGDYSCGVVRPFQPT